MRVPRDLLPFVMPNDFIPDTGQASATQNTVYSREEIEIASFLTTCTSYNYSELQPNLVVIPWGCRTNSGIQLANTCPIDNWLMIFQALSGKIDLDELNGAGNNIKTALLMVDLKQYGDAKIISLPTPPVIRNGIIDLYGNEADYLITMLQSFLATTVTSFCNLTTCPSMVNTYKSHAIALGYNDNSTFISSLNDWLHPKMTYCQRKFQIKPPVPIPSQEDVTLDCDGKQSVSWHFPGIRTSAPRSFLCFKNFFSFSVDLLSTKLLLRHNYFA